MLSYEYPCDHQSLTEWWAILSWICPYPPHLASIIIRFDPVHEPRPTSVQPRKHLLVRAVAWDGVRDVKTPLHDLNLCTVLSNCPNKQESDGTEGCRGRARSLWSSQSHRLAKSTLAIYDPAPPTARTISFASMQFHESRPTYYSRESTCLLGQLLRTELDMSNHHNMIWFFAPS